MLARIPAITFEMPFDEPNLTNFPPSYLLIGAVAFTALILIILYTWR